MGRRGVTTNGLIADLMAAFPRQKIGRETLVVYLGALADIPLPALQQAVQDLIASSEWFPTVAAIRQAVAENTLALPSEAAALEQIEQRTVWAREGAVGEPPPLHPLVKEALDHVGGSYAFKTADDPGVLRGQFGRLYRDERARAIRDAQVGRLSLPPAPDPEGSTK